MIARRQCAATAINEIASSANIYDTVSALLLLHNARPRCGGTSSAVGGKSCSSRAACCPHARVCGLSYTVLRWITLTLRARKDAQWSNIYDSRIARSRLPLARDASDGDSTLNWNKVPRRNRGGGVCSRDIAYSRETTRKHTRATKYGYEERLSRQPFKFGLQSSTYRDPLRR